MHPAQLLCNSLSVKQVHRITWSAPSGSYEKCIRGNDRNTCECKQTPRLELVWLMIFYSYCQENCMYCLITMQNLTGLSSKGRSVGQSSGFILVFTWMVLTFKGKGLPPLLNICISLDKRKIIPITTHTVYFVDQWILATTN